MGKETLVTRAGKGAWIGTCLSCSSSASAHPEAAAWWPSLGYRNPPAFSPCRGWLQNLVVQQPSQAASESAAERGSLWCILVSVLLSSILLFGLSDPSAPPQPHLLLNWEHALSRMAPGMSPPLYARKPESQQLQHRDWGCGIS